MTDKYKDLRDALAAGPKPGKWTWKQVGSFNTPGCAIFWPDSSKGGIHYRRLDSGGGMEQQDAEYIAAANPETIRALLAERDALREALDLVNDLSSQEWQDQNGKRMAATGNDGKRFWFITDDVMRVVRAALALAQGEA